MTSWFGLLRRRGRMRTDVERAALGPAAQLKLEKIEATKDARYESMTDEQRDAYYLHPSLRTRLKRFFQGD